MSMNTDAQVYVGARVRLTQRVAFGSGGTSGVSEGTVLRCGQQKTGSWFAHSRDDKLWIDRIELRLDDGEVVVCNIDSE